MAIALILLALGSVVAGFIGVPHALGGHNTLGAWLEPSFRAPTTLASLSIGDCAPGTPAPAAADPTGLASLTVGDCAAPGGDAVRASNVTQPGEPAAEPQHTEAAAADHAKERLEQMLMGFSTLIALLGIGIASWIWLKRPEIAERFATAMPGLHRLLLNKYYVDEVYDATVVQPIRIVSEEGLWRGMDARVIDGMVNGSGQIVGGMSAVLRLFQSGSVKAYAASTFMGVVLILAYYIWR
jgi:NADH-quinone oxidoreductase subunit L